MKLQDILFAVWLIGIPFNYLFVKPLFVGYARYREKFYDRYMENKWYSANDVYVLTLALSPIWPLVYVFFICWIAFFLIKKIITWLMSLSQKIEDKICNDLWNQFVGK